MSKSANRMLTIVLLLLMMLATFFIPEAGETVSAATDGSDDGIAEFDLSVRGTFLHADAYQGGGGSIDSPLIVSLQAMGISPEDNILISFNGQLDRYAGWNTGEPVVYEDVQSLIGVYSTSSELLSIDVVNRVPGAVGTGFSVTTGNTHFGQGSTDIPEDFKIAPKSGIWMQVPRNAEYLFICFFDSYYYDNIGWIKVTIEKDTDGDGIPDSWELFGIDVDKDGIVDLDLPMLGADYEHKDIFVEADFMADRAPNQDALRDVKNAFANAPVTNPDGIEGINLHVNVDESVPAMALLSNFDAFYAYKSVHFGTEDERSHPKTIEAKKLVFRYCIFAVKIWFNPPNHTCPGVAELRGDDFILAFGALTDGGTREEQAAVFMHELGHTLGLGHGGDVGVNYKPNYISVMNYAFQFNYLVPNRPLDYSEGLHMELNETDLDENLGIGNSDVTAWSGPNGTLYRSAGRLAIDWNGNGVIEEGVQVNLNVYPDYPSPANEELKDYNDWANLEYRFRGTRLFLQSATPEDYHAELTAEEIANMRIAGENIIVQNGPEQQSASWPVYLASALGAVLIIAVATIWFRKRRK